MYKVQNTLHKYSHECDSLPETRSWKCYKMYPGAVKWGNVSNDQTF